MRRIFLFFLLLNFSINCLAGQPAIKLFAGFDDSGDLKSEELYMPYKKIGTVELNSQIFDIESYGINDKLSIDLFDDTYLTTIDRINQNVNGTLSIRARFDDYPTGYIIINKTGRHVSASVDIPEKNKRYSIRKDVERGVAYIKLLDIQKIDFIESAPPLIPDKKPQLDDKQLERLKKAAKKNTKDTVNVDVMIVYTPAAKDWASVNHGSINNTIAMAMENAELGLENSETKMSVRLVYSDMVHYTESGSSSQDLSELQAGDGEFAEVHDWRETYGADLVALFAEVSDVGGIAWLLTNRNGNPAYGFSLTRVQQAGTTFTHIHEMGHNMGCHHHMDQTTQPGPTIWGNWPGNNWSAGWRWKGDDNQMYCTIMTYESGQFFPDGKDAVRVPYFSNPDIVYEGGFAGHPADGDNARTLREIRHVIAAYKDQTVFELSLDASPHIGGTVEGEGIYLTGDDVTVSAIPEEHFEFTKWTDEDGNVISEDKTFEYQMPDGNANITANFEVVGDGYVVLAEPNDPGYGYIEGEGYYEKGEQVTLTAYPETNHEFIKWTEGNDIVHKEKVYEFIAEKDRELVANFKPLTYKVTFFVEDENGFTIEHAEVTLDDIVKQGGICEFEEIEPGEYYFTVTADGYFDTDGTINVDESDIIRHVVMKTDDTYAHIPEDPKPIVYPNPVSNELRVNAETKIYKITFADSMGKVVYDNNNINNYETNISVNNLESGLYIVTIYLENRTFSKKVLVK